MANSITIRIIPSLMVSVFMVQSFLLFNQPSERTLSHDSPGEEFGTERLSTRLRPGHLLSADRLMDLMLESVTDFCRIPASTTI